MPACRISKELLLEIVEQCDQKTIVSLMQIFERLTDALSRDKRAAKRARHSIAVSEDNIAVSEDNIAVSEDNIAVSEDNIAMSRDDAAVPDSGDAVCLLKVMSADEDDNPPDATPDATLIVKAGNQQQDADDKAQHRGGSLNSPKSQADETSETDSNDIDDAIPAAKRGLLDFTKEIPRSRSWWT
ncbi:hypothetical protein SLS53_007966 [Cytospora paraplurivora]|uniref:Uncharacterized protein n=1 Tax=Cytospora paraplurivora TaxID=2898453 RepID=A0AAN9TZY1_9PEZI